MAFGAIQQFPNDTQPRVGIGVNIPFNEGGVFTPNYLTATAIKNNLINYFLTNPGERPGNPSFGGGLRAFIFEQIVSENIDFLREDISTKVGMKFPNIVINNLDVLRSEDSNTITVQLSYIVVNTSIRDEIVLNFA
jgi:phage baseplate assembly protein W